MTWEDADAIKQQFLAAPTWGHAATQGEGGCPLMHLKKDPIQDTIPGSGQKC